MCGMKSWRFYNLIFERQFRERARINMADIIWLNAFARNVLLTPLFKLDAARGAQEIWAQ